jgi:hypothetical protein
MEFYSGHPAPGHGRDHGPQTVRPDRGRVAAGLDGEVAETGLGSGLNIACHPPAIHRIRAVDPARLGRALAAKRLAAVAAQVEFADLDIAAPARGLGSVDPDARRRALL